MLHTLIFHFSSWGKKKSGVCNAKVNIKKKQYHVMEKRNVFYFFFFKASVFFVRTLHIFSDGCGVLRLGLSTGFSSSMLLALVFDHIVK